MPKFSILTACHNNAPYLNQCIESVFAQTYLDWEWIIVDDCSSDESWRLIQNIKDSRVKIFRNDHRSYCSSTYRRALSESDGEVCGVLDADDVLDKNALDEVVRKYVKHKEIGYLYTQHYWCDSKLKVLRPGVSCLPKGGLSMAETFLTRRKHCFSHFRTFKRSSISGLELFPDGLKWAVDKYMGFVLEEVAIGAFLDEKLYYYRYHNKNMSLRNGKDQKRTCKEIAQRRLSYRSKMNIKTKTIVKVI